MSKIKQSGRLAFQAGIKKCDCPFATGSIARRSWLRGWNEAQQVAHDRQLEDQRANRKSWPSQRWLDDIRSTN